MKENETPDFHEFEALFVNNNKVSKLETYLNRFNPIRIMKMERMEIRHSSILGWLMNPSETHGFGDRFLKAFLSEAFRGTNARGNPNAIDIARADLSKSDVRIEWNNLDIFVFCPRPEGNWAFVIENKYDSTQSDGQLFRYREKLSKHFAENGKKATSLGVFLTLWEEAPDDPEYVCINYETVFEILKNITDLRQYQIGREVRTFVYQYLDIIGEATEMNKDQDEMEKLALELYREHRKAIDFIVEHGTRTDFGFAVEDLVGDETEYQDEFQVGKQKFVYFDKWNNGFRFLPVQWYKSFGGGDCEFEFLDDEFYWEGVPIICWFQLKESTNGGKLWLYGEVGPLQDFDNRKSLLKKIGKLESTKTGYQSTAIEEGKKYSKFFKKNSILIEDVNDSEIIANAMRNLLNEFKQEFDDISNLKIVRNGRDMAFDT